jgi:hypothetical protein
MWSELADAALPDDVPELARAKRLLADKAETLASGADDGASSIQAVWDQLDQLRVAARDNFPLSEGECLDLRASLKQRLLDIYERESAALEALGEAAK